MKDRDGALGVFDSGLGGLTVARAIRAACPHEDILYLGDSARVPYGTRSAETVIRYAEACAGELARRGVKAIVVACNTVSAVALDALRSQLDMPVIGVVVPGARAAHRVANEGAVGVLATVGTISSGAYRRAVTALSSRAEVIGQPAPLLVALAEEGWLSGEVPTLVVRRYLEAFVTSNAHNERRARVRCVVLGCTHFPPFKSIIEAELTAMAGEPIPVVDSADETAKEVQRFFTERNLATSRTTAGTLRVLVTDMPKSFGAIAARFLGEAPEDVQQIDLAPTQPAPQPR